MNVPFSDADPSESAVADQTLSSAINSITTTMVAMVMAITG